MSEGVRVIAHSCAGTFDLDSQLADDHRLGWFGRFEGLNLSEVYDRIKARDAADH